MNELERTKEIHRRLDLLFIKVWDVLNQEETHPNVNHAARLAQDDCHALVEDVQKIGRKMRRHRSGDTYTSDFFVLGEIQGYMRLLETYIKVNQHSERPV